MLGENCGSVGDTGATTIVSRGLRLETLSSTRGEEWTA